MVPFIISLFLIGLSELGDKTQLLTLSFATRYPFRVVALPVLCAVTILQALAIGFGGFLASAIDLTYVGLITGSLFVAFGIWGLIPQEEEAQGNKETGFSPFMFIFIAFFLSELGDKSQLGTVALTMKFDNPFMVFWGAALGMGLVNLASIWVGSIIKNKVAAKTINLFSATVFIIYGVWTIIQPLLI